MITLLVLLIGSITPVDVVIGSLQFFLDLKRDIDGTLQHAKKKTRRLCQAVEFAGDYLRLFEGPAEELDGTLDGDRRQLLTKHLVNLSESIVSARTLVEDLKKKSRAAWFAHGGSFRDQLVAMTEQLEVHTDNLHKMLSTGSLEVALRNSSRLQALQNQAADRPPLDEHDPEEAIPAAALTENERAEATGWLAPEFTAVLAQDVAALREVIEDATEGIRRANGAVQSGKMLLAELEPRLVLHGDLAKLCKALEEDDFRTLEHEVHRVLALINVEVTPLQREEQRRIALGHVEEPLRTYRRKIEDVRKLLSQLTRDNESAATIAMEAVNRLTAAVDQYDADVHAEFERFVQVHKAGDGQPAMQKAVATATKVADTFVDKLGEFLDAMNQVLQAERWLFMAKAHRLIQSVSAGLRMASAQPVLAPTRLAESKDSIADDDDSDVDIFSAYDIPSLSPPHREDAEGILARVHARLEQFFEPAGDGKRWRQRDAKRIKQRDMEALRDDMRMLEVVATAWQKQAGLHLQREAASNIFVLTNFFENMPKPGETGSEQVTKTLDLVLKRLQAADIKQAPAGAGSPERLPNRQKRSFS